MKKNQFKKSCAHWRGTGNPQIANDSAKIQNEHDCSNCPMASAITDGHIHRCIFDDGHVYTELDPGKGYPLKNVKKTPKACEICDDIVYRVTIQNGMKCVTKIPIEHNDD